MRFRNPLLAAALASALMAAAAPQPERPPEFAVSIAGGPLGLHEFTGGKFAVFELAAPAPVLVETGFDVRWVNIRPKSAGVVATIGADHHSVSFRMDRVIPLTVEFNDDLTRVVHLFAYEPETEIPIPTAPNIRYFGPGLHDAGVMNLKDGEGVYLAPGAWVRGAIRSVGTRNVRLFGRGVLDGSGLSSTTTSDGRQSPVYLERTTGARIEGVTLFNSHDWTLYMTSTSGTRVKGIRILNPGAAYGDDGIDVVSSSDVVIEDTFVRTNDDCVVVKNLDDIDTHDISVRHCVVWDMPSGGNGLEVGFETRRHPIRHVRFEDIDIIHVERGAAISIHNGDSALVEDVAFDDIRVEDARRKLIDFAVVYAQYGADRPPLPAENARRLDVGGSWDGLLWYAPEEKAQRAAHRGRIAHVRVTRLQVVDGALPYSVISGFDRNHEVADVLIEGLRYDGRLLTTPQAAKLSITDASDIQFR